MKETIPFTGIDKRGFDFLRALKRNNDRDWFRERKPVFEEVLQQPAIALIYAAAEATRRLGFPLQPKPKSPLTRIYRDVRFSSDKTPFHTHVGGALRRSGAKDEHGELYIHIQPDNCFLAAGFWMPERPFLQAWREKMAAREAEFRKVLASLKKSKLEWLEGYSLKRLPRGWEGQAGGELEEFFKKQVFIVRRVLRNEDLQSRQLPAQAAKFAVAARPLLEWGWSLGYKPKRDILESEF